MKKSRYWVCQPCGKVYRRYVKDVEERPCSYCKEPMVKARKYPGNIWRKHQRNVNKQLRERERNEKRYSILRTAFGSRFYVTASTRKTWRKFCQAKQRRSFIRLGNLFLEALREDVWSCPHHHGYLPNGRDCNCGGGGSVNPPKMTTMEEKGSALLGHYRRSLFQGVYSIEILWQQEDRLTTLIHEVTHYIDDMSRAEKSGVGQHTRAFFLRMADLAKQLRYELPQGALR